ncbi:MAG: ribonuclease HIII [Clostridia bacterium]|jgi:ribonuclease HIII|nr:ribonuclease HIII [Clostridia bacterium]MDD4146384.1 ribonuclease HIII [Clostridia bacterium]MDD4665028.1 ribonuclease HIII [Clostridia bacterium]
MSKTYQFVQPREQAVPKFKDLFINMEIEWLEEQIVNNGYGRKIKAKYQESPFSAVIYFNKQNYSSKIVLEKGTEELEQVLAQKLGEAVSKKGTKQVKADKPPAQIMLIPEPHIGTDESGKGDYFGPLVIAGVFVEPDDAANLREMGVADSKTISDLKIKKIAPKLRLFLKNRYNLVFINPEKYNELYSQINNLNKLLAWGHARVIENLLQNINSANGYCEYAVADKFGDERFIEQALMKKGRQIKLIQIPRAEQDLAVAAASVLARDLFLTKLEELSQQYGLPIPKGCNEKVKNIGQQVLAKYGREEIGKIAKLHFKTTQEIMG